MTYLYQVRMKTLYTTSSSVAHHLPMELASRGDEEAILDEVDDPSRYVQPSLRAKAGWGRRWRGLLFVFLFHWRVVGETVALRLESRMP